MAIKEITLNTSSRTSDEIQFTENGLNYKEYIITDQSGTPWAASATVYIERYLSSASGWVKILQSPLASTQFAITFDGAGIGLLDIVREGKVRFVLTDGDGSTDIKITLI